jgi:signal transduction histidine kinase
VIFNASDQPYTTSTEQLTHDLSHDLRTPLAIIRMQAQLLIRLTKRGAYSDGFDRERLLVGLKRIDDAVTKLNKALGEIGIEGMDKRPLVQDVH